MERPFLGPGIGAAFTDRTGGMSAAPFASLNLGASVGDDPETVRGNRRAVAAALGLDADRVAWMRQVHGSDVAHVTGPLAAGTPGADAVVTETPGVALAVVAADCIPVLLADPVARIVGAAHSGRPGTAAGVVSALIKEMCSRGAEPGRIKAAVGPAVCGACYEVPAALRDEVASAVPETYTTTRQGTPGLDIRAGVAAQLRAAGVTDVLADPRCTMESPELYSHRREGRTGRFAGYIWLEA